MRESGAKMVEVGTTNKTHLRDYTNAITPRTGLILKVHTSNYRVVGFTEEVPLEELVSLVTALVQVVSLVITLVNSVRTGMPIISTLSMVIAIASALTMAIKTASVALRRRP